MKISVAKKTLAEERAPLLGCLVDDKVRWKDYPAALAKTLSGPKGAGDFEGKALQTTLAYHGKQRLLLIGLGKAAEIALDTLRRAAAAAARRARSLKITNVAVVVPPTRLESEEVAQAVAEGLVLGNYEYHGQKTSKADPDVKSATIYAPKASAEWRRGVTFGQRVAEAQCLARDLGNAPGNVLTATAFAREARKVARNSDLRCRVLTKAELVRRKFGGILGVNQGSKEPPVFIEMEYRPKSYKKTVCLIGKGLTFDAGGISLKPAASMEEMKYDMCGGAAVLGAMAAIAKIKPKVRVYGLIPSTDNLPSGSALKPGDVIKSYGGISMEIINTDAEGRLILADALGRAQELKPDYTIDLATLTGACVVALGHRATGLFTASEEFRSALVKAGEHTHERFWPLPHWPEYQEEMKSTVADIKNSGGRWGGAVTAYAFLLKFAGDLNWAHLDIAGTAWDMPKNEYYQGGATGSGVRALVHWLNQLK